MRNYSMKTSRNPCKFLMSILLLYSIAAGCSGTTQTFAQVTLVKIPLGHDQKAPKNKPIGTPAHTNYLPETLGDLSLFNVIQNQEAARIIDKMHGKTLDDCKNYIARYGNMPSKNILYVSVYENAETAKTNLKNMAMKMANGSSVFSPLTHTKMGDTVYFETEGMGLLHYFYRKENILIWWQVEPDYAETTFNDLLEFDFKGLNNRETP